MHKILMEEGYKSIIERKRRLNPNMQEVVKLLDIGIIYLISDSSWVSPIQCVLKKGGMTGGKSRRKVDFYKSSDWMESVHRL